MKTAPFLLVAALVAGCSDARDPAAPPEPGITYTLKRVNNIPIADLPISEPWEESGPLRLLGATLELISGDRSYINITIAFTGTYARDGDALQFTGAGLFPLRQRPQ